MIQEEQEWYESEDGYKFLDSKLCEEYENNILYIKDNYCPGCYVYWDGNNLYGSSLRDIFKRIPKTVKINDKFKKGFYRIKELNNLGYDKSVRLYPFGTESGFYIVTSTKNIYRTHDTDKMNKDIIEKYFNIDDFLIANMFFVFKNDLLICYTEEVIKVLFLYCELVYLIDYFNKEIDENGDFVEKS